MHAKSEVTQLAQELSIATADRRILKEAIAEVRRTKDVTAMSREEFRGTVWDEFLTRHRAENEIPSGGRPGNTAQAVGLSEAIFNGPKLIQS